MLAFAKKPIYEALIGYKDPSKPLIPTEELHVKLDKLKEARGSPADGVYVRAPGKDVSAEGRPLV